MGYKTAVARQQIPDRACAVDECTDDFQEHESHHEPYSVTVSKKYSAKPFTLLNDNLGAVQTVTNPTSSVGNRHLDLRYFKTREYIKRLLLVVSHIPTNLNVADMFTKPLLFSPFNKFRGYLGIIA